MLRQDRGGGRIVRRLEGQLRPPPVTGPDGSLDTSFSGDGRQTTDFGRGGGSDVALARTAGAS